MQTKKAQSLRAKWGNNPCDHPDFDKEYDFGAQTGDYVCTQCGEEFTEAEKNEIIAQRERDK